MAASATPDDALEPSPAQPFLDVRDVERTYGRRDDATHALRGASLAVDAGELVAIQGRSGSGKTTFLNVASGLDAPDTGTVHLFGHPMSEMGTDERLSLRALEVGFVFQEPALVPELRLWENAAMAARIRGLPAEEARASALAALEDVELDGLADRFPGEVSGGEAQRASVARALAKQPRLLLADEPTAALDHTTAEHVSEVLERYVADGEAAGLVVTHDDLLARRAHRTVLLRDGVLHAEGPEP